jgi:3-hydroxyacyl-[acyl-carrier protein] dehydratase/trans-2-decenoyl-[acyl-carrier protein] isomerase
MTYDEFGKRDHFTREELLAYAHGSLITNRPEGFDSRLPLPPMLMIDRILEITRNGQRGRIVAERDVRLDDWFFQCHFLGDPVQPGCLGVDGVWQLLGYFCSWAGGIGAGRALGCGEIEFAGQIRPHDSVVRYEINVRRYTELRGSGAAIVVGDAQLFVDDAMIYEMKSARVGLFRDLTYRDYPFDTERSHGGRLAP